MNPLVGLATVAYFVALAHFTYYLLPSVRKKHKLFKSTPVVSADNFYERNLHYFVIARQVLLFLLPVVTGGAVSSAFFDSSAFSSQLTSLFVLGLAINVFWVTQLPSLTKANILVTFASEAIDENPANDEVISETYDQSIVIKSGRINRIICAIYSLGFSAYKNAMIIIYLGNEFEIFPCDDPQFGERLKKLDFFKTFAVQKKHGGAAFTSKDNFLTIPPQEVFLFPLFARLTKPVPKDKKHVHVEFSSESSWGITRVKVPLQIIE